MVRSLFFLLSAALLSAAPSLTFLGAYGQYEDTLAATSDARGFTYVAGSNRTGPATPGAVDESPYDGFFVTKLAPNGDVMFRATLNGSIYGIAVDQAGNIFVAEGYYVYTSVTEERLRIVKMNPTASEILYDVDLTGGTARAITVDASGNAYVTGQASAKFVVTTGAKPSDRGYDAFVMKIDPTGKVVYTRVLGGSGSDEGRAIAVDAAGRAHITGVTQSVDFPMANAMQMRPGGSFLYRSNDRGTTWSVTGSEPIGAVNQLVVDPGDADLLYATLVDGGGIAKTTNGGATWVKLGVGLDKNSLTTLVVHPKNPALMWGADRSSLFRSVDGGYTWSKLSDAHVMGAVAVAIDPANEDIVWAGGGRGLAKSTNKGGTWTSVGEQNWNVSRILIEPGDARVMYIGGYSMDALRSIDGGTTWTAMQFSGSFFAPNLVMSPSQPQTLYITGSSDFQRSDDRGATWRRLGSSADSDSPLAVDPLDPEVVFSVRGVIQQAGGSYVGGDVYRYNPTAKTWTRLSDNLPGISAGDLGIQATAIGIAPSKPTTLYFAASPGYDAFVTQLDESGARVLFSTYLGGLGNDYGSAITVDRLGNIVVTGGTSSVDFAVTPGAAQPKLRNTSAVSFREPLLGGPFDHPRITDAFAAKLNSLGSLVYLTYLGGEEADWGKSVATDEVGRSWITGYSKCATFPKVADNFVPVPVAYLFDYTTFLAQISADGKSLRYSTCFGGGGGQVGRSVGRNANGTLLIQGQNSSSLKVTAGAPTIGKNFIARLTDDSPQWGISGVVDPFTFRAGPVGQGSVATIFGVGLATSSSPATNVPLPQSLAGASVTIDGRDAPLFYAGPNQINVQIPWETGAGSRPVVVKNAQGPSEAMMVDVTATAPSVAVYAGTDRAIAVNQDNSLNGAQSPERVGNAITFYLVGQGPVTETPPTGGATPSAPTSTQSYSVSIGGVSAQVVYFGLTPQSVGLAQLNVRVPDLAAGEYEMVLKVGEQTANRVKINVKR